MRLAGKVALITGSSSGIGAGIAARFADEGATVVIHASRDIHKANDVAKSIQDRDSSAQVLAVTGDVALAGDVEEIVNKAVSAFGHVDILVNNAGVFTLQSLVDHPEDVWDKIFNVNVKGTFLCCREVVPHFVEIGGGRIINIGSIFGAYGVSDALAYGSSKMAVHGITRCLAIELARKRITVNCIAPGNIYTDLNRPLYESMSDTGDWQDGKRKLAETSYPVGRVGDVKDVAGAAAYLASDDADFVTGQVVYVDGGYSVW